MRYVIGVDEVGRGPLAGPVVVAAVRIPQGWKPPKHLGSLRDSKQLTHSKRALWDVYLRSQKNIRIALCRAYPKSVDRLNISKAANHAAHRAFRKLAGSRRGNQLTTVFLDGGLYLRSKAESIALKAKTVVKGDETIPAIALASVVAKEARDRYMRRLAKRYPTYGFDIHKGYGTAYHRIQLAKYGPSPVHRLTFIA